MKRKISADGLQSVEDPMDDDESSQGTSTLKKDDINGVAGSSGIAGLDEESPDIANYTYFPRLFRLRQDHNIKQEIVCHLSKLHHITKDHKGFYRVRICRTCSGLPHLLELGSYSDLESATLVNDVHEFLNNRTRHLHVITEEDIRYIDQISVTRTWRHERSEVKLLELLQERLDKSKSNQSKSSVHYSNPYIYGQGLMGMPPGGPPPGAMGGMWGGYQGQVPPPQHVMGGPQQHFVDAAMMASNGNPYMMQRMQGQQQPQPQQQQSKGMGGGLPQIPGGLLGPSSSHQQGPPSSSMYPQQSGPGGNSFSNGGSSVNNSADSNQSSLDDGYDAKSSRVTNFNVDAELKAISRGQEDSSSSSSSQQQPGSSSNTGNDLGGLHSLLGAAQSLMPASSNPSAASSTNGPAAGGAGASGGGNNSSSGGGPAPWGVQPQSQYQSQQQHQQQSGAQQHHNYNPMMGQQQQQQPGGGPSMFNGGGGMMGSGGNSMGQHGQANAFMHPQHQQQPQAVPSPFGMWGSQHAQHPQQSNSITMSLPSMPPQQQPSSTPNMFQQHQQFLMQQQQQQSQQSQPQNQSGRPMPYPPSMQQQQQQNAPSSFMQQQQASMQSQMSPRGMPNSLPQGNRGSGMFFGGPQGGMNASFDPSNPAAAMIVHSGMTPLPQQMHAPPSNMDASNAWSGGGLGNVAAAAAAAAAARGVSKADANQPLELSEETIQRVTLMTYEFEGAKNFLFQKLNCACAVDNSSYFVNLALDSLIALFVAPSYANPVYTQNAIRAIEYVMSSGCITSASLYLLAVAYTPGGYETSTMMMRNLHSAMKMYERKFEQQACSSRRMSFYSSKVIQYMKSSNISKAKVLDGAKPKIEATGKLAQLENAESAISSTSSSIARASNVLNAVQSGPFPTVPSGGSASNVPYKTCSVVTMPASMAEWEAYFSKILRCNHTIALKCDLNVRMPVWWPNSFQPFGQSANTSSNISNFLHFECIIRGEFATSQFHYNIISNLVDAFVEAGYESHIVSLNRTEKERLASTAGQGLGEPEDLPVFACTTTLLMLCSYGTCTIMMRSLELLADLNVLPSSDCVPGEASQSRDNGLSRVLETCIVEYCRWKKYFDDRISDPAVIGMYQSIFMDLLILLLGSKRDVVETEVPNVEASVAPVADNTMESAPALSPSVSDTTLTDLPDVSPVASEAVASTASAPAESAAVSSSSTSAEGNNSGFISSRFKTLLDVIADVAPLPVGSAKDQRTSLDISKFSTKNLSRSNIYSILRELVKDTQSTGIASSGFQHPLRADNNKFAPHFTIAHEISLRVNMSSLSILSEVSACEDHCIAESAVCSSIRGLLNPEASILGVYREMLFLGEWMDASEGGCPLFSHTYTAFWLCLKACRKLVPKYPNFADILNKILVLIPRILKSCSRRNGLCTVLLEFEEEEGFVFSDPSAPAETQAQQQTQQQIQQQPAVTVIPSPLGNNAAPSSSAAVPIVPRSISVNVNVNDGNIAEGSGGPSSAVAFRVPVSVGPNANNTSARASLFGEVLAAAVDSTRP